MDYITLKFNKKIAFLEKSNVSSNQLIPYYQSKIEYTLILATAYLWDKNFNKCDSLQKERLLEIIYRPTLGELLEISRILDSQTKEFFTRQVNNVFNDYINIRNSKIGHGYTYEDGSNRLKEDFRKIISDLEEKTFSSLVKDDINLISVTGLTGDNFEGIAYRSNGDYDLWICSKRIKEFQVGSLYLMNSLDNYYRLSPFLHISSEDELYLFNRIQERLTGQVKYNQIFKTGNLYLDWHDFTVLDIENDGVRRKSSNKTIINVFENNFSKYIELGVVKEKILDFLLKNKASVAATIWGHGGVGKTATIQYICDQLLKQKIKAFDYIVFLSAKDRFYNYLTGTIQSIENKIDSFEGLIKKINYIVFQEEKFDVNQILDFEGRILLVIDDYETFSTEDKKKIEDFVKQLDINHHKVIVTTRANLVLGHELQISELSKEETKQFLIRLQAIEFPNSKPFQQDDLNDERIAIIHDITSGRPLFIFQFAYVATQRGLKSALSNDYKAGDTAVSFLYGRIFEYLSLTAQRIFVVMGLLTTDENGDLTNLLEKIKYMLNLEHQEDAFQSAISELEKLRIVEIIESKFFKIYSQEIQSIMLKYYQKSDRQFKGLITQRLEQISIDKELDNEWALLRSANNSRYSKNEMEVIDNYRRIVNRPGCPHNIKLQAIINLGGYLFTERGKKDEAIQIMEDYKSQYMDDPEYVKMYSIYTWSMAARSQREKSIQILLDYFSRRKGRDSSKDISLELLGNLLTNRSIFWIDRREETKAKYDYQEISNKEFQERKAQETRCFLDIYRNQGMYLLSLLKNRSIDELSSGARQNIVAGLYQFVNICIRLHKHDTGKTVCQLVIDEMPPSYSAQFNAKLQLINKFSAKENKPYRYNPL